ncbi:unnamed protein product [Chondrus crispus]|uniref:Uncharacterized protein n=1 Tax=Chondrus crispus TaxID=2769 RepID=R7QCF1_CHOCR|nr:unnamed protein product [Chondrus crispus]CDF35140.1 unnamed protein product [Chondrus crispus]|eukprot:XP_005714959.1 unnamed protein product [Chondrus crispus]
MPTRNYPPPPSAPTCNAILAGPQRSPALVRRARPFPTPLFRFASNKHTVSPPRPYSFQPVAVPLCIVPSPFFLPLPFPLTPLLTCPRPHFPRAQEWVCSPVCSRSSAHCCFSSCSPSRMPPVSPSSTSSRVKRVSLVCHPVSTSIPVVLMSAASSKTSHGFWAKPLRPIFPTPPSAVRMKSTSPCTTRIALVLMAPHGVMTFPSAGPVSTAAPSISRRRTSHRSKLARGSLISFSLRPAATQFASTR